MKSWGMKVLSFMLTLVFLVSESSLLTVFAAEPDVSVQSAYSGEQELTRLSGSGSGFMYYNFVETTDFYEASNVGKEYAFLDAVYDYEDAVTMLGAGAVLQITDVENNCIRYMDMFVAKMNPLLDMFEKVPAYVIPKGLFRCYVDVVEPGKDFDQCPNGGLRVLENDTGVPTEYRYYCANSGVMNAGPLYAYTYDVEGITWQDISVKIKDAAKAESADNSDYIVNITFKDEGVERTVTLNPGSYTIQHTEKDDEINVIVEDEDGNVITTRFKSYYVVTYEGGTENVADTKSAAAREDAFTFAQAPVRAEYAFQGWKEKVSGDVYGAGDGFALEGHLTVTAQWKDSAVPEVTYIPLQVVTGISAADLETKIKNAFIITDNEPVEECTVNIVPPAGQTLADYLTAMTRTAGKKTVEVAVIDAAGNTNKNVYEIDVIAVPIEFDIAVPELVNGTNTYSLKAELTEPGSLAITESGFVWGVLEYPTTTFYNGRHVSNPTVNAKGDVIAAVTDDVQYGVSYYARAYVVSGGVTYYSAQEAFGLGIPEYGTFSVSDVGTAANNATVQFTVSRTDGTDGPQTVYYRTVNGSAVGGTHFEHKAGMVEFADGETSKTVDVTVYSANKQDTNGGDAATQYSNADRVFWLEIYRVEGGGKLASAADDRSGECKLTTAKTVSDTIYTTEISADQSVSNGKVADRSGGDAGDVYWMSDREWANSNDINYNNSRSLSGMGYDSVLLDEYIKNTSNFWLYRYKMHAYEERDCHEHAWMGLHAPSSAGTAKKVYNDGCENAIPLANEGGAIWTARFLIEKETNAYLHFPSNSNSGGETNGNIYGVTQHNKDTDYFLGNGNTDYAKIPINSTVYNYFSACGSGKEEWTVKGFTDYSKIYDTIEPQVVTVAPMAGGSYKLGDKFTVALIFDEIVDSTNSSLTDVSLNTTWGSADYAGGADTNVLYFTGTISASLTSDTLTVNSISNTSHIKDMCSASGETSTKSAGGTTEAKADAKAPEIQVEAANPAITAGTGKVIVKALANTDSLSYAWSDSESTPAAGWVKLTAAQLTEAKSGTGFTAAIRKEPGEKADGTTSGNGIWYLHARAVYNATGQSADGKASVSFGTAAAPAPGAQPPVLTVTPVAENTWTNGSRTISFAQENGTELFYKESSDDDWTALELTDTSVTVNKNGYYTFRLAAGDQTLIESAEVAKIDKENPAVTIGGLTAFTETTKEKVYTEISLPVSKSDNLSGIATAQYVWSTSTAAPASGWMDFSVSESDNVLNYVSDDQGEKTVYLHVKVTDFAGNSAKAVSQGYRVIDADVVNSYTPGITLKSQGAVGTWTNDSVTVEWTLTNEAGKDYAVTLPDGTVVTSPTSSGTFIATENGTYSAIVKDNEYGGENKASVAVSGIDKVKPAVSVQNVPIGWQDTNPTVTLEAADADSGLYSVQYKIVPAEEKDAVPTDGFSSAAINGEKKTLSQQITVSQNGIWYIYAKVTDNTGYVPNAPTETPAEDIPAVRIGNETIKCFGPIMVDIVTPSITMNTADGAVGKDRFDLELAVTYGVSGVTLSDGTNDLILDSADKVVYPITAEGTYTFTASSGAELKDVEKVDVYKVNFDKNSEFADSTLPEAQLAVKGGRAAEPDTVKNPSRTGYTFAGWYTAQTGGEKWDFANGIITASRTLYAHWTANTDTAYVVNHWTQNLGNDGQPQADAYTKITAYTDNKTGTSDAVLTMTDLDKTIAGFTYSHGKVGSTVLESTDIAPDGSRVIDLYYTRNTNTAYAVKHYKQNIDGTYPNTPADTDNLTGVTGATVTSADVEKTYAGFTIKDSNVSGVITEDGTMVIDVYYIRNKYQVIYEDNDATSGAVASIEVLYEDNFPAPASPQRTGYDFAGWYKEAGLLTVWTFAGGTEPDKMPAENITLYAKWNPRSDTTYYVDYYQQNINDDNYYKVSANTEELQGTTASTATVTPIDDKFTGFHFSSGNVNNILSDTIDQFGDMRLKVYYDRTNYNVTFSLGEATEGTAPAQQTKRYEALVSAVADPSWTYYRFDGWFTALSGGNKWDFAADTVPAGDITLYAHWMDVTYPTGIISLANGESWNSFDSTVDFESLFYNTAQTVTITGADNGRGVSKVYYYLSDAVLTENQIKTLADGVWTELANGSSFNIALVDHREVIVYAKIVDMEGNATYINSEGITIDNLLPVIAGIADGDVLCAGVQFEATERNLLSVTVNGTPITASGGKYYVNYDTGNQNLIKQITVTDKAGNALTITVDARGQHTYGAWHTDDEAECIHEGRRSRVCEICQYIDTDSIPANGLHSYAAEFTVDKEATVFSDGQKSRHCTTVLCDAVTDITVIPRLVQSQKPADGPQTLLPTVPQPENPLPEVDKTDSPSEGNPEIQPPSETLPVEESKDSIDVTTDGDYEKEDEAKSKEACSLCHFCPTFLGLCCFVWLAFILILIASITAGIVLKKKSREETE